MGPCDEADGIINKTHFRSHVFEQIPMGSRRILDFGCGNGALLLRLKRDKGCEELFGVEIDEKYQSVIERHLTKVWIMDLGDEACDFALEFKAFFNTIIMHDVLEHLYDPWYVLAKLRNVLAPGGKIILVVPNFRQWTTWFKLTLGEFLYGEPGGFMNEEHIRWFTLSSVVDLARLSGLEISNAQYLFPENVNVEKMKAKINGPLPFNEMTLPPEEVALDWVGASLKFSEGADLRRNYPELLANKLHVTCVRDNSEIVPERTAVGTLQRRREALGLPIR